MSNKISGQIAVEAGPGSLHGKQGKLKERSREYQRRSPLRLGLVLLLATVGFHTTSAQAASANSAGQNDPANGNMAPVDRSGYAPAQPARVLGQSAHNEAPQQAGEYSQQPAPIERRRPYNGDQSYGNQGNYGPPYNNQGYNDDSGLTDQQAADLYDSELTEEQAYEPPPPLPVYYQPAAPYPDYIWTPGYWAWGPGGYYWVPGAWVAAPYVGALWTPGYWDYYGDAYRFHRGFWGLHIGFYGGINYGFGYFGHGYYGGYWDRDHFRYNTECNRIDRVQIPYFYARSIPENYRRDNNRVSFDGGRGGLHERPMEAEYAVLHERRNAPMESQMQVQREASQNRQQFFNQNRGRPVMTVAARPVVADPTPPAVLPEPTRRFDRLGNRDGIRSGQIQTPGQQGRSQYGGQQIRNVPDATRPGPDGRPVQQNGPNQANRQGQPEANPNQPQLAQPPQGQPQPQFRRGQPQPQQGQPQFGRGQPQQTQPQQTQPQQGQPQQGQPQPQFRRGQPQPQGGSNQPEFQGRPRSVQPQPQTQPQANPNQPQPQDRRFRPQSEVRLPPPQQAQPQPQGNATQPQPEDRRFRPQPEMRQAQPQPPQAQPRPQFQMRQAPQQPQPRPQEQARPQSPPPQSRPQPAARPAPQLQRGDPRQG